jgi:hypothetical protein
MPSTVRQSDLSHWMTEDCLLAGKERSRGQHVLLCHSLITFTSTYTKSVHSNVVFIYIFNIIYYRHPYYVAFKLTYEYTCCMIYNPIFVVIALPVQWNNTLSEWVTSWPSCRLFSSVIFFRWRPALSTSAADRLLHPSVGEQRCCERCERWAKWNNWCFGDMSAVYLKFIIKY